MQNVGRAERRGAGAAGEEGWYKRGVGAVMSTG